MDLVAGEEDARAPGVLAGHGLHLAEHPDRPMGDVLEVADGGRDHEQGGHGFPYGDGSEPCSADGTRPLASSSVPAPIVSSIHVFAGFT